MKQCMGTAAVAAGLVLLVAPVWAQQQQQGQQKQGEQRLDTKDASFVKEAANGNMLEVKLGEHALRTTSNPDIKKFAQRMIDDHGKANKELQSVAGNKGITFPTDLDSNAKQQLDKFSQLKGADFDKQYIMQMVKDHEQDVSEFQKASQNLQDADIKAWVMKTLPTLNEHLREAKQVETKVEKK
jgi:putative membrane protein